MDLNSDLPTFPNPTGFGPGFGFEDFQSHGFGFGINIFWMGGFGFEGWAQFGFEPLSIYPSLSHITSACNPLVIRINLHYYTEQQIGPSQYYKNNVFRFYQLNLLSIIFLKKGNINQMLPAITLSYNKCL